jgi:hypothetical protein
MQHLHPNLPFLRHHQTLDRRFQLQSLREGGREGGKEGLKEGRREGERKGGKD